ncbi:hypothetical protein FB451DRAFT_1267531, partial [Mycena latifolia]
MTSMGRGYVIKWSCFSTICLSARIPFSSSCCLAISRQSSTSRFRSSSYFLYLTSSAKMMSFAGLPRAERLVNLPASLT